MLTALKGKKCMNRAHGLRVTGLDADLTAALQLLVMVADYRFTSRHFRGAGNFFHVDDGRRGEITLCEGCRNRGEVLANHAHSLGIVYSALQLDPPTIGQTLEFV